MSLSLLTVPPKWWTLSGRNLQTYSTALKSHTASDRTFTVSDNEMKPLELLMLSSVRQLAFLQIVHNSGCTLPLPEKNDSGMNCKFSRF